MLRAVSSIAFASSWNSGENAVDQSGKEKDMVGGDLYYIDWLAIVKECRPVDRTTSKPLDDFEAVLNMRA